MMMRNLWEKRRRRAEDLLERKPSSSEVLAFYSHLLALQQRMAEALKSHASPIRTTATSPLREQLDPEFAMAWLPVLLDLVRNHGPAKMGEEALRIRNAGAAYQREMLTDVLRNDEPAPNAASSFLARALFQPHAEFLASQMTLPAVYPASLCPLCGGRPQLAVLRPEGDGGKRHLVCSFCLTEWEFRRVICPVCAETDYRKLPRYSAEEAIAVRVEACDACKGYLKSFDMTVDGLLVPEVDEIATVALDVWASQRGYHKFEQNLLGF